MTRGLLRLGGCLLVLLTAGCLAGPRPSLGPAGPAGAAAAEPFYFTDQTDSAGLTFRYGEPPAERPLSVLETAPGGCAFLDYDLDGRLDVFLAGLTQWGLFRNVGGGRFRDVTPDVSGNPRGPWMGCAVGDYDNDGYPDVLVTGYRACALLRNLRGRRFQDTAERAGLRRDLWTTSAAFADIDADGWLDLYVGAYLDYHLGRQDLCRFGSQWTACGPEMYGPERGRLYRNLGDGRFQDRTEPSGLSAAAGKTWGVGFADYDADGDPDLYLANDQVRANLFRNDGGFRFTEVGTTLGTAYAAGGGVQGGMGVDWADYNGDGRLDLFVPTYVQQENALYRQGADGLFQVVSADVGLSRPTLPYVAFGSGFLDADNNGALDLFVANGHIRSNVDQLGSGESYAQPLQLFANDGSGRFSDVSSRSGPPFRTPLVGRGVAFGDYDDDGRVDILVADLNGSARLLRNESGSKGNWISIQLDGGPRNRDAIGALVTARSSGLTQVRQVTTGRSVLSACDPRVHLGLGAAGQVDAVTVRWPDGKVEAWGRQPAGREVRLSRGSGAPVKARVK